MSNRFSPIHPDWYPIEAEYSYYERTKFVLFTHINHLLPCIILKILDYHDLDDVVRYFNQELEYLQTSIQERENSIGKGYW